MAVKPGQALGRMEPTVELALRMAWHRVVIARAPGPSERMLSRKQGPGSGGMAVEGPGAPLSDRSAGACGW